MSSFRNSAFCSRHSLAGSRTTFISFAPLCGNDRGSRWRADVSSKTIIETQSFEGS